MLDAFGGEPWCWPYEVICRHTDAQLVDIIRAAARRGKKKGKKTRLPTRDEFVSLGMTTFGLTREQAERQYEDGTAGRG